MPSVSEFELDGAMGVDSGKGSLLLLLIGARDGPGATSGAARDGHRSGTHHAYTLCSSMVMACRYSWVPSGAVQWRFHALGHSIPMPANAWTLLRVM